MWSAPIFEHLIDVNTSETRSAPIFEHLRDVNTSETRSAPIFEHLIDVNTSETRSAPIFEHLRYLNSSETRSAPIFEHLRDVNTSETRSAPIFEHLIDVNTSETRSATIFEHLRDLITSEARSTPIFEKNINHFWLLMWSMLVCYKWLSIKNKCVYRWQKPIANIQSSSMNQTRLLQVYGLSCSCVPSSMWPPPGDSWQNRCRFSTWIHLTCSHTQSPHVHCGT